MLTPDLQLRVQRVKARLRGQMKPKLRFKFLQTKKNTVFAILDREQRRELVLSGCKVRFVIEIAKKR